MEAQGRAVNDSATNKGYFPACTQKVVLFHGNSVSFLRGTTIFLYAVHMDFRIMMDLKPSTKKSAVIPEGNALIPDVEGERFLSMAS
jgi:hypothetical protein